MELTPARELSTAKQAYRRQKADEAYERICEMADDRILKAHDPRTYYAANQWVHEQGYGKTPDQIIHHQGAKWEMALEGIVVHIAGGSEPVVPPVVNPNAIIDTTAVEESDEFVLEFNYTSAHNAA